MNLRFSTPVALFGALLLGIPAVVDAADAQPLYQNDFESTQPGQVPKDFLVTSGGFEVQVEGGNKVLELPGAPLDTFGLLFGPSQPVGVIASGRFFGSKQGRKFPTFGISLNGVGGYRLQVSPAKKAVEFFKGDEPVVSAPFEWVSGAWTRLKIRVQKSATGGCVIEGKAWADGTAEPSAWTIRAEEKGDLSAGRAGIWGSPYSGTPIQFDDLLLVPAP